MAKARKMPPSSSQMLVNRDLQRALTSLGLEGIQLTPDTIADLNSINSGKLSKEEALARVLARARK